jgi:hypothetical protein
MLTVRDETELRQDLASRREMKYVISAKDVPMARKILSENAKQIVHHQSVSQVRSLYFDDPSLSACFANIHGLGHRKKLRLRWYDSLLPQRNAFLEIKWRVNRVTGKQRLRVDSSKALSDVSFRELWRNLRLASESSNYLNQTDTLEPVVVVEYRREHFVAENGRLRFTIDYDLRFYDQTGRSRWHMQFPVRKENFAVIEGKSAVGDENQLQAVLYPLRLRAARCSKYVHACQSIGLIHEGE